jgi:hypothetical protein
MNKVSLDVRSEIMDKVEEIQPDILVLGARGLGTVRGYLHHPPPPTTTTTTNHGQC